MALYIGEFRMGTELELSMKLREPIFEAHIIKLAGHYKFYQGVHLEIRG